MIYVYENKNGFRVVRGNNPTRAKEHLNLEPRVYTDEKSAYAVETNSAIKGAILRLDPSVAEGITPVSQHHVIKNSAKSTSISSRRVHTHHFIVVKYSPSGEYARFYAGGNEGPHIWTYGRDKAFVFSSREAAQDAARTYSGAMIEETPKV